MKYPNILYIDSHDTGRYVQPYGHAMPTPNIQRLAEGGVGYSAGVLCQSHMLTFPCQSFDRQVGA